MKLETTKYNENKSVVHQETRSYRMTNTTKNPVTQKTKLFSFPGCAFAWFDIPLFFLEFSFTVTNKTDK
uniref:Early endosome antigen n=1 Tax=Rhizophora mucronata TaxID=61149 RepID=A0A2P2Q5D5_RHIMU